MGFYSFQNMLRRWIHHAVPEEGSMRILEWGPGKSTVWMREELSDAVIYTYEDNRKWYDQWKHEFELMGLKDINLFHVSAEEGYSDAPRKLGLKFHFIFVDGLCEERVNCLRTALDLLEEGGYVMLHDSTREIYNPGKHLFEMVQEASDTAVMVRKPKESEKID